MDEIDFEKYLSNYPKPVSLKSTEKIVEQMKNNICRIALLDGTKGTGFFCKIVYYNIILTVLITNNHVINEKILKNEEKIVISVNKKQLEIKLKNRITYTNIDYDISIIEIKENKDKINSFLELDENIINNASNIPYIKKSLYILQYESDKEEVSVSYGILKGIKKSEYEFEHLCCTQQGSSGGPIFNLQNLKVIGLHRGASKKQINLGIFLNFPIQYFIEEKLNTPTNIKNDFNILNRNQNNNNNNLNNKLNNKQNNYYQNINLNINIKNDENNKLYNSLNNNEKNSLNNNVDTSLNNYNKNNENNKVKSNLNNSEKNTLNNNFDINPNNKEEKSLINNFINNQNNNLNYLNKNLNINLNFNQNINLINNGNKNLKNNQNNNQIDNLYYNLINNEIYNPNKIQDNNKNNDKNNNTNNNLNNYQINNFSKEQNNNLNNNLNNDLKNENNNTNNNINNEQNNYLNNIEKNKLINKQNNNHTNNEIDINNSKNNIQNNYQSFNQINIPKKINSIQDLDDIPMIGLDNLGQTSYINSVLQCLSNISPLTNYFLNPNKKEYIEINHKTMENKNALSLSLAYKDLIDHLWKGEKKVPYSPTKFIQVLNKLKNQFIGNNLGKLKDFACYLINEIHTELNNIDNSLTINNPKFIFDKYRIIDSYNSNEVLQNFLNYFTLNHNSIISQIFFGINQVTLECQTCKLINMRNNIMIPLIKYNYNYFFFIEFPLDEIIKIKYGLNNSMNIDYLNNKEVNIYDCFNYNKKNNKIEGICQNCRNYSTFYSMSQIYSGPNILMIIFDKGNGIINDIKINFPNELDVSQIFLNYNNPIYELIGVINHLENRHFISYCKSPILKYINNWYCYNDNDVSIVKDLKIGFEDTCILFYKLKK